MFYAFLLSFLFSSAQALSSGAPASVCHTMMPSHGGAAAQTEPSPYSINVQMKGVVQVDVGLNSGYTFKGFILQARDASGNILGEFEVPDFEVPQFKTLDCDGAKDTLTHTDASEKESITVLWKPPNGYDGAVVFHATVVQSFDIFWQGIQSAPIHVVSHVFNEGDNAPIPYNPFHQTGHSTTPPNFVPDRAVEVHTNVNPFYAGCGLDKLCFGAPVNCVQSRNCKAAVTVRVIGDRYEFELKADSGAAWVAVGLSDDEKMGEDSALECVNRGNNVAVYMSWTTASPYGANRLSNPQLGIQLLNSSIIDGAIYCKVQRDVVTNVNGKTFDLVNGQYYLLIAAGSSVKDTSVSYHDRVFTASAEPRYLAVVSSVAAASKLLIRLHGSFMLAAWIGTASIGILLARYYRKTWVGTSLMGKDLWFAWHRIFMVLTWALTLAAFILIFVELKQWSKERNPHAILGTITSILCFFQPIGAYFRPHPGTTKRPLFNWGHWLAGNVAHILAIVTIFFSVKLTKAELPDFVDWILVVYVAVHVVTHLILSVMGCISEKSSEGKVTAFPMNDLGGTGRSSGYADRSADAPFSPFRRFLLGIYIVIILALVIALIVITALAPIVETFSALKSTTFD